MNKDSGRPARPLPTSGTHLPALDGLRGVAILLVLAMHFTMLRPLGTADAVVYSLARTGWMGVDLFFVLSGFLITGILFDSRDRANPLRTFYARRFLRIFPLYYGFLIAVFGLGPLLAPRSEWLARVGPDQLWHWVYLSNVLAALKGWTEVPHLGHFWSLAIEEQFYLLWPLAVLALPRGRLIGLSLGLLAVSLGARAALLAESASPIAVYALTFTRWDGLAVGALIALLGRGPGGLGELLRWSTPVLAIGPAALTAMVWAEPYRSHYGTVMQLVGYPLVALVCGALLVRVLAAPADSRLHRALCGGALGFFGRYSYGIYLLHVPLQGALLSSGFSPRSVPPLWGSALPGQVAYWAVAAALTVASALLAWHLWERPFLSLKRHFAYAERAAEPPRAAEPALLPSAG